MAGRNDRLVAVLLAIQFWWRVSLARSADRCGTFAVKTKQPDRVRNIMKRKGIGNSVIKTPLLCLSHECTWLGNTKHALSLVSTNTILPGTRRHIVIAATVWFDWGPQIAPSLTLAWLSYAAFLLWGPKRRNGMKFYIFRRTNIFYVGCGVEIPRTADEFLQEQQNVVLRHINTDCSVEHNTWLFCSLYFRKQRLRNLAASTAVALPAAHKRCYQKLQFCCNKDFCKHLRQSQIVTFYFDFRLAESAPWWSFSNATCRVERNAQLC